MVGATSVSDEMRLMDFIQEFAAGNTTSEKKIAEALTRHLGITEEVFVKFFAQTLVSNIQMFNELRRLNPDCNVDCVMRGTQDMPIQ